MQEPLTNHYAEAIERIEVVPGIGKLKAERSPIQPEPQPLAGEERTKHFALYEAYGTRPYEWGSDNDRQKANTKEEESDLNLLNEGMRYRDLETGVFLTRDPIGYGDGPNVYCYVHCNPITHFDAWGLSASKRLGKDIELKGIDKLADFDADQKTMDEYTDILEETCKDDGELMDVFGQTAGRKLQAGLEEIDGKPSVRPQGPTDELEDSDNEEKKPWYSFIKLKPKPKPKPEPEPEPEPEPKQSGERTTTYLDEKGNIIRVVIRDREGTVISDTKSSESSDSGGVAAGAGADAGVSDSESDKATSDAVVEE